MGNVTLIPTTKIF